MGGSIGSDARNCFFAFVLCAVVGCNFYEDKARAPEKGRFSSTFPVIQQNILQPKCVRCHSGPSPPLGVDLTSYAPIMRVNPSLPFPIVIPSQPEESDLYRVVNSGQMPRGGPRLSEFEIKMIYEWIKNGAKEREAAVNLGDELVTNPNEAGGFSDDDLLQ